MGNPYLAGRRAASQDAARNDGWVQPYPYDQADPRCDEYVTGYAERQREIADMTTPGAVVYDQVGTRATVQRVDDDVVHFAFTPKHKAWLELPAFIEGFTSEAPRRRTRQ